MSWPVPRAASPSARSDRSGSPWGALSSSSARGSDDEDADSPSSSAAEGAHSADSEPEEEVREPARPPVIHDTNRFASGGGQRGVQPQRRSATGREKSPMPIALKTTTQDAVLGAARLPLVPGRIARDHSFRRSNGWRVAKGGDFERLYAELKDGLGEMPQGSDAAVGRFAVKKQDLRDAVGPTAVVKTFRVAGGGPGTVYEQVCSRGDWVLS